MVKWEKHSDLPEMWLEPKTEDKYFKEERFVFSPIVANTFTLDNIALLLLIAKFSKTPEGMKMLKDIIIKYLDSCARIVESVEAACHSNWLTALNNQHISAAIAHRIGLIDDGGYLKIVDHYRNVFDKMLVQKYVVEGLNTLVQVGQAAPGIAEAASTIAPLLKAMP